jgi:AcrR family transcriptional regulator
MTERVRLTAPERRTQIVEASLRHFAKGGLHGTSTEAVAEDIGLSQPYLFRLFGTKRELFLACCEACIERTRAAFRSACAGDTPEDRLHSMGRAYRDVLADEDLLGFQLQMYAAASGDPVIAERARALYEPMMAEIESLSGAGEEEVYAFFGTGMLLNVATTLGLERVMAAFHDDE